MHMHTCACTCTCTLHVHVQHVHVHAHVHVDMLHVSLIELIKVPASLPSRRDVASASVILSSARSNASRRCATTLSCVNRMLSTDDLSSCA